MYVCMYVYIYIYMHICKTIVTMKSPPIQSCDPTLLDLPFSALSLHAVQQMTDCLPAAFEKSERAVHVPRSQPDLCWCTPRLLPNLVEIQHHVLSDGVLHPAGQGALLESVFAVNRNPSLLTTPVVCVNGCPTLSISKIPRPPSKASLHRRFFSIESFFGLHNPNNCHTYWVFCSATHKGP